jgi:5-(carboxyamino)imidazole ribonucleotide mutase
MQDDAAQGGAGARARSLRGRAFLHALLHGLPRLSYRGPTAKQPAEAQREETALAQARVAILMGSKNDYEVMRKAEETLRELDIDSDTRVISAHRTPERLTAFLADAESRGIEVVICGAGGAAHLAGVTAAHTLLPVLGVPIDSSPLSGLDALLSTVQMPGGIPVATFGIGRSGAQNAALFAAHVIARKDAGVRDRLAKFRQAQSAAVPERP